IDLDDDRIDTLAISMLRSTYLAELLSEHYLVAVAGAQGAGKTTLVREIYGLDRTWLRDNPGRGERVPVMIVEREAATGAAGGARGAHGRGRSGKAPPPPGRIRGADEQSGRPGGRVGSRRPTDIHRS